MYDNILVAQNFIHVQLFDSMESPTKWVATILTEMGKCLVCYIDVCWLFPGVIGHVCLNSNFRQNFPSNRFTHDFRSTDKKKIRSCLNQMGKIILTKNLFEVQPCTPL